MTPNTQTMWRNSLNAILYSNQFTVGKRWIVTAIIVMGYASLFGQTSELVSNIMEVRKQRVHNHHKNAQINGVLTGKHYNFKYLGTDYHSQFYEEKPLMYSTLCYDGVVFDSINTQYDLYSQKIVVLLESNGSLRHLSIDEEKISYLLMGKQHFTYVKKDSVMPAGIYHRIYNSERSNVFVQRKKDREEIFRPTEIKVQFVAKNSYYVRNEFGTFLIKNRKSLFNAYRNSEQVLSILKSNKVKLPKKDFEYALISALSLIESKLNQI